MTVTYELQERRLVVTVETEIDLDGDFHDQSGGSTMEMVPIEAQVI